MAAEQRREGGRAAPARPPRFYVGQPIFFTLSDQPDFFGPWAGFVSDIHEDELSIDVDPVFCGAEWPDSPDCAFATPPNEAWPRKLRVRAPQPLTLAQKERLRRALQEINDWFEDTLGFAAGAGQAELDCFDKKSERYLQLRYAEVVTRNAAYRLPPQLTQEGTRFPMAVRPSVAADPSTGALLTNSQSAPA